MIPQAQFLTIDKNLERIKEFIDEIIIAPKATLRKWSSITNQTPAVKLGYIGQHLASLITGVKGTSSGARGDDLEDSSEVKSCNKIDQADKCEDCEHRVMRYEDKCPYCGSQNIKRKEDSKWLFSVRSEEELNQYLNLDRVILILMDYPNFDSNDFNDIRISAFEIYPKDKRMHIFGELLTNHYYNIYLPKINDNAKTNPMNLHPFKFQFYKCNPIKTFECIIKDVDSNPSIIINHYIEPNVERDANVKSEDMPAALLKPKEWAHLIKSIPFKIIAQHLNKPMTKNSFAKLSAKEKAKVLPCLPELLKDAIPLRPITSIRQQKQYQRN